MKKTAKEVTALTRTYDLILWSIPDLEKFPKGQKYLLGDRIERLLLEVLELLIQAVYTKNKLGFLKACRFQSRPPRDATGPAGPLDFFTLFSSDLTPKMPFSSHDLYYKFKISG